MAVKVRMVVVFVRVEHETEHVGFWEAGYAVSWFECGLNRNVKFVKIL